MMDKDLTILMKIIQYADEISGTVSRFELDFDRLTTQTAAIAIST